MFPKDDFKDVFATDYFVYNSTQITTLLKVESDMTSHASDQQRCAPCDGPRSGVVIAEAI